MLSTALLLGVIATAGATSTLPRNTVLEVTAEQDLSLKNNREGDRFSVVVQNDRDLPRGTRLIGEIDRIEEAGRDRPAYMDLSFNTIEYPGGRRERLRAVPISLDNRAVERDREGRLRANPKKVRTENYVIGGALGGLIVGGLLKKPGEGLFVGTLAGIVLAESERQSQNRRKDLVLRKGMKIGALLEEDLRVDDRDDRWNDRDDRDDRDDRWNDRDGNFDLRCGDERLRFDRDRPYRRDDQVMVPLDETARALGLEIDRREDRFWIDGDRGSVRLQVGSREARRNGQRAEIPIAPERRGNVIYVPLAVLASLQSRPVTVDGNEVRPWTLN